MCASTGLIPTSELQYTVDPSALSTITLLQGRFKCKPIK